MAGWKEHAACRGEDDDLFFPDGHRGQYAEQVEEAKEICRACPVTDDCLRYAINKPERYGIWGALDELERADLRRRELRHVHPQFIERPVAS